MNIRQITIPASNYRTGRHSAGKDWTPQAVVIHLSAGSFQSLINTCKNPASEVSAHYGVSRAGEGVQFVAETDSAFHAGKVCQPTWPGLLAPFAGPDAISPNAYLLGIEHEGTVDQVWTDEQYAASAALVRDMCDRWSIPIDELHIVPHRAINAMHSCPGPHCDIGRIIREALA